MLSSGDFESLNGSEGFELLVNSIETGEVKKFLSNGQWIELVEQDRFEFRQKLSGFIERAASKNCHVFFYLNASRKLIIRIYLLEKLQKFNEDSNPGSNPDLSLEFLIYSPGKENVCNKNVDDELDTLKRSLSKLRTNLKRQKVRRKLTDEDRQLSNTGAANAARKANSEAYAFYINDKIEEIMKNESKRTLESIADELNKLGYETRMGKPFTPNSVRRVAMIVKANRNT